MGKQIILYFASAILLASCSSTTSGDVVPAKYVEHKTDSYLVNAPTGFSVSGLAPSNEYFYFGYAEENLLGIRSVEIYDNLDLCPLGLGISNPKYSEEPESNLHTWQGKWDTHPFGFSEDDNSLCVNYVDPFGKDEVPGSATYLLCSEKNGKAVMICIHQSKDNPSLAKEIFESFKWTE